MALNRVEWGMLDDRLCAALRPYVIFLGVTSWQFVNQTFAGHAIAGQL